MKRIRAVRGGITVERNGREEVLLATKELATGIMERNQIAEDDLISAVFTVTPDVTAAFPAEALRQLGLTNLPVLDTLEMKVPGSLELCIRVMIHFYTDLSLEDIQHVYLRGAKKLRPDWVERCN